MPKGGKIQGFCPLKYPLEKIAFPLEITQFSRKNDAEQNSPSMKSIAAPFRKGAPTFLWFLLPVLALLLAFLGLSAFHTNQNPMQNLHNGDYEAEWR
ncbi:MAG: hypothetical protein D6765_15510, partial [Bacteroidetes bacterium]